MKMKYDLLFIYFQAIAENPTELTLDIGIMYPGNAEFQLGIREIGETSIISGKRETIIYAGFNEF